MQTHERVPISFHIDKGLKEKIQASAQANYRSMAKETELLLQGAIARKSVEAKEGGK